MHDFSISPTTPRDVYGPVRRRFCSKYELFYHDEVLGTRYLRMLYKLHIVFMSGGHPDQARASAVSRGNDLGSPTRSNLPYFFCD